VPGDVDYLALPEAELLRQCEVDTYRASGPGGQKRNKTSSAVRLRHTPTGLMATATESRSQHENRARALRRLRERIAVEVRRPIELEGYRCSPDVAALVATASPARRAPEYLRAVQRLLDLFVAAGCSVRDTAAHLGVTSAALSKTLVADEVVARAVNELRTARGLRPLR
jgi:hypothetical protein